MSTQSLEVEVCITNKDRDFGLFGQIRTVLSYSSRIDPNDEPRCVLQGPHGVCNCTRAQHVSKALPHLFKFALTKDDTKTVNANSIVLSSTSLTDTPTSDALLGETSLVACLNGVLDMKAGVFLPHDSPRLVGKVALAYFDSFYQEHYRNKTPCTPYWDAVVGNCTVSLPGALSPTRVEISGPTFEQGSQLLIRLLFGSMFGQTKHNVVLVIGPEGSGKTVLTRMVRTCMPVFYSATCGTLDKTRNILVSALRSDFLQEPSLAPIFLDVEDQPKAWLRILLNMFNANVETYVTPWNDLASKVRLESLVVVEVRKHAPWMSEFPCVLMSTEPCGLRDELLPDRHTHDCMALLHKASFVCNATDSPDF